MANKPPMMTLAQLSELLRTGNKLSPDELASAQQLLQSSMAGKVPEMDKSIYGDDYDTYSQNLFGTLDQYKNTPEGKQFASDMLKNRGAERFVKRYKPFFNAILQGADIANSLSQIRNANKSGRSLVRPGISAQSKIDPALNAAIRSSQNNALQAERTLAPAKQEISSQFNSDIARAAQLSGGQGASYGANANAASLRRSRAAASLPAIQDQIAARNNQRTDNLLSLRNSAMQQGDVNRFYNNRLATDQYNTDATLIGNLGASGRSNLRNSMATLPDNLLGIAGRMLPVGNPYGYSQKPIDITGGVQMQPSSPSHAAMLNPNVNIGQSLRMMPFQDYSDAVDASLAANIQRLRARGPQSVKFY